MDFCKSDVIKNVECFVNELRKGRYEDEFDDDVKYDDMQTLLFHYSMAISENMPTKATPKELLDRVCYSICEKGGSAVGSRKCLRDVYIHGRQPGNDTDRAYLSFCANEFRQRINYGDWVFTEDWIIQFYRNVLFDIKDYATEDGCGYFIEAFSGDTFMSYLNKMERLKGANSELYISEVDKVCTVHWLNRVCELLRPYDKRAFVYRLEPGQTLADYQRDFYRKLANMPRGPKSSLADFRSARR